MVLPNVLCCRFVYRQPIKNLWTYSESSFPGTSYDTNFSSLGLLWAEQLSFKDAETICEEQFCARNLKKLIESLFGPLNSDFSAQDSRRELKLVSIEPPWNKDSEYCSTMSVNEKATQNVQAFQKKSMCWNRRLLVDHVVEEPEECGHIWVTTRGESVNFRGSRV